MSWNVSYASLEDFKSNKQSEWSTKDLGRDCLDQLEVARVKVSEIIASDCVGKNKDFAINLSGHANPNHEPATGWANDCVSISITQKSG